MIHTTNRLSTENAIAFRASQLNVISLADTLILLNDEPEKGKFLKEILSGSMNFFERDRSHAKDIFWEIETWAKIRKRLDSVYLSDPNTRSKCRCFFCSQSRIYRLRKAVTRFYEPYSPGASATRDRTI